MCQHMESGTRRQASALVPDPIPIIAHIRLGRCRAQRVIDEIHGVVATSHCVSGDHSMRVTRQHRFERRGLLLRILRRYRIVEWHGSNCLDGA